MPVDDRNRLDLHRKLEAVLGHDEADTLMAHLPPVTWQDVATKSDVDTACTNLHLELRADFVDATNRQIKWLVGFAAVWTTVLVTLVRLMP